VNGIRFALRHAAATGILVGGVVAFAAASYFALLGWAMLVGEPLGGPFALPFMVLVGLIAGVSSTVLVFFPAAALAEWIGAKRNLSVAAQIPIATGLMGAFVLLASVAVGLSRGLTLASAASIGGLIFVLLVVPLGVYWWAMRSSDWLVQSAIRWRSAAGRTSPSPSSSQVG
jgi:hypothetical protein